MKPNEMALAAIVMAFVSASNVYARPARDFETAMRAAYAHYRASPFATNADKPGDAVRVLPGFTASGGNSLIVRCRRTLPTISADREGDALPRGILP